MTGQIILGDCIEEMAKLPAGSIDLICTDLPYGTTVCAWDSIIDPALMWPLVWRVLKPAGAFVTTAAQPFTSALVMSQPKFFRYELIWDKVNLYNGALNANRMPLKRHENILVFYRKLPTYNKQFRAGTPFVAVQTRGHGDHTKHGNTGESHITINNGQHNPCSIIPIKADVKLEKTVFKHPTKKPVELFEYLIKTYSNPGETVLDIAAGSGTTGAACQNTGRNFILIDNSPIYCETMRQRLVLLQTAKALYVVN